MVVLGISIGTRLAGIAVKRDGELITHQVKVFKGVWNAQKQREILTLFDKVYAYYGVTHITLKTVNPLHTTKSLHVLITTLTVQAEKKNITVKPYSLHAIKKALHLNSKENLMEYVAEEHYELRKEYLKEKNSFHPYYMRMFEAIALTEMEK
ncbi:MAG: hypothetical protein RJA07_937 [Bacteroidota bacterium]|jgi:hypothetical protein